ncbi:MAG: MarR family transcriptional regulator [Chloroflexota bacterium]
MRLETWHLFLQVHARVVDRLEATMEVQQGIPLSWFDVMLQLSFAPGARLRMHELLQNLVLTRSGLTRRVDRMETAGLVVRQECADDARGVLVALTATGTARLQEAIPGHLAMVQEQFAQHLTDAEVLAMWSGLRKILDATLG